MRGNYNDKVLLHKNVMPQYLMISKHVVRFAATCNVFTVYRESHKVLLICVPSICAQLQKWMKQGEFVKVPQTTRKEDDMHIKHVIRIKYIA